MTWVVWVLEAGWVSEAQVWVSEAQVRVVGAAVIEVLAAPGAAGEVTLKVLVEGVSGAVALRSPVALPLDI